MGNKSKRRQGIVAILDEGGNLVGYKHKDVGYGRSRKNRRSRGSNTKTAVDREEMLRQRRERYMQRRGLASSGTV